MSTHGPDASMGRSNDIDVSPTKTIALVNGGCCWVDAADYKELSRYRWRGLRKTNGKTYVVRQEYTAGARAMISLHRHILKPQVGEVVDHIDGNPLNNSRSNLRITDRAGNARNRQKGRTFKNKRLSSRYKGVTWDSFSSNWKAQIMCKDVNYHLGRFTDPVDAAKAYDSKASELFGEFAYPNFPYSKLAEQPRPQDAPPLPRHDEQQAA